VTDNPHYHLARRIEAAYDAAERSCDRADFRYFHALNGIATAEVYATEREVHTRRFPTWSEASEPGTVEHGPFTPAPE